MISHYLQIVEVYERIASTLVTYSFWVKSRFMMMNNHHYLKVGVIHLQIRQKKRQTKKMTALFKAYFILLNKLLCIVISSKFFTGCFFNHIVPLVLCTGFENVFN